MNLIRNANTSGAPQNLSCEALYQNYSGILYGVIKNTVKDTLVAEVMLEQIFLKIYSESNERAVQISFLTWAIQQTLASVKEHRDKQPYNENVALNNNPYISAPKELRETDDYSRYIFDLVLQGYNANEISDLLEIPLTTVVKNLRTGMKLKAITK